MSHPPVANIDRINELTKAGRSVWFGLLAFLAFIGVTLLGVVDADFFLTERQTSLPLIGVEIPTVMFFTFAPVLAASFSTYLHINLIRSWRALSPYEAPPRHDNRPLSDAISPWLVSEYALYRRDDGALGDTPPIAWLAFFVTRVLTFWATPLILLGFFIRSMPAHNELLTIFGCGLPLVISIYAARRSAEEMHDRLRPLTPSLPRWLTKPALSAASVAILAFGWLTTEGTLDHYARKLDEFVYGENIVARLNDDPQPIRLAWLGLPKLDHNRLGSAQFCAQYGIFVPETFPQVLENCAKPENKYPWAGIWVPVLLYPANLSGIDFADLPRDWKDHAQAQDAFYRSWWRNRDLPEPLAGPSDAYGRVSNRIKGARFTWCTQNPDRIDVIEQSLTLAEICQIFFEAETRQFLNDWRVERDRQVSALTARNFSGADLRMANLSNAVLIGVDFSAARMQGARFVDVRGERAVFAEALLQGSTHHY
ncbi:MAG: pentapeptide repeat-containing protein, partial [Mangrovicoccus sp.]